MRWRMRETMAMTERKMREREREKERESFCLSVRLSACLSICLFIYGFVCIFMNHQCSATMKQLQNHLFSFSFFFCHECQVPLNYPTKCTNIHLCVHIPFCINDSVQIYYSMYMILLCQQRYSLERQVSKRTSILYHGLAIPLIDQLEIKTLD